MLCLSNRPKDNVLTIKKNLQDLEHDTKVKAAMEALRQKRRKHFGSVCIMVFRGLLLTENGFRLRNLVNFYEQTPVSVPHPSVERITRKSLLKRPGLVAKYWQEKELWINSLTPERVLTGGHLAYVGLDEWSRLHKVVHFGVVAGSFGLVAVPGMFMWDVYERRGTLGGASVKYIDQIFKKWGYAPHGKPPPLRCMPREIGTQFNLNGKWGDLGQLTPDCK